ncbi:MAG TPA: tetratricopeptide repeat protein [Xanthomonadaceae bacterium]|nr:tetratricopeptide repeat protein [Xanthomonadaceae bacterium]
MTDIRSRNPGPRNLLAAAVGCVFLLGLVPDANAQLAKKRNERYNQDKQEQSAQDQEEEVAKYPQATRGEPDGEVSRGMRKSLNAMIKAFNADEFAEARTLSAEILADADASAYDKAVAAQIGAHAAYDVDDLPAAMALLQQSIDLDVLDNNDHYGAMLMLAQMQIQEGQEAQGLATLERFLAETKSTDPQHLILKGNTLYNLERWEEAAVATKAAIEASPDADPSWTQLLMGIYLELDRPEEATRIAEQLAARDTSNKQAQINLASIYLQNDQFERAAAVLEKIRASGELSTPDEYRQLYATYLNMEGRESEAIAVIEDGLAKGILQPNYEAYVALAQSYYFSKQDAKAIDAYKKAAPLDEDGETYLNLARVLWQADRIAEAKQAAQQALDKGLDDPEDARRILALP